MRKVIILTIALLSTTVMAKNTYQEYTLYLSDNIFYGYETAVLESDLIGLSAVQKQSKSRQNQFFEIESIPEEVSEIYILYKNKSEGVWRASKPIKARSGQINRLRFINGTDLFTGPVETLVAMKVNDGQYEILTDESVVIQQESPASNNDVYIYSASVTYTDLDDDNYIAEFEFEVDVDTVNTSDNITITAAINNDFPLPGNNRACLFGDQLQNITINGNDVDAFQLSWSFTNFAAIRERDCNQQPNFRSFVTVYEYGVDAQLNEYLDIIEGDRQFGIEVVNDDTPSSGGGSSGGGSSGGSSSGGSSSSGSSSDSGGSIGFGLLILVLLNLIIKRKSIY